MNHLSIVWLLRHSRPCWNGSGRRAWPIAVAVVTLVGDRRLATARPLAAAVVQGARLPDALGHHARRVAPRCCASRPAQAELRAIPGVRNFGAHIGQAFAADEVVGVNFRENWISISREADHDKTHARIEEMVEGYPGLYRDADLSEGTHSRGPDRRRRAIVVRIFGPDLDVLGDKAERGRAAPRPIPDLVNLHKELMVEVPHIQVTVKLEKHNYVLKPGDVRRASAT